MSSPFIGIFTIGQTIDRGIKLYKMLVGKMFLLLLVPMLMLMTPVMTGMRAVPSSSPYTNMMGSLGILYLLGLAISIWVYVIQIGRAHV